MNQLHPILFSTGSLHVEEISTCFKLAKEAGFDGIEIIIDRRRSTFNPVTLNRLSDQYNLPIKVIHNPFFMFLPDSPDSRNPIKVLKDSVALAEAVNAESVVLHLPAKEGQKYVLNPGKNHTGFTFNNPDHKLYQWIKTGGLRNFQNTSEVKICVENMPKRGGLFHPKNLYYWNNIKEWSTIHDYLTLDTTHWGTWNLDPLDAFKAGDSRVRHIHLSNFNGREHQLPENGTLNLSGLLRAVAQIDHKLSVTLELCPDALDYQNERNVKENLSQAVQFMRKNLAPTG